MKKIITILALILSAHLGHAQLSMIVQPSGGLNNGTDSGTATAGKETWVNRYAPTVNEGASFYAYASPRSNCNPSDTKSYFQFDVTDLPVLVDSVFFGVTHAEHTSYCYSNCDADFYFYRVTSPWDEMALVQSNLPTEDTVPFFGPRNITFPNDYQNQEYDITSAYNYWKTPGNMNYGFTIYSPTVGCNNASVAFNVHTSDDTVAANRPYLKIYYHFPAAINETASTTNLNAYPNPFSNFIKSDITNPDAAQLTDISGRKIKLQHDATINGYNTEHIAPGMYILQLTKKDKTYTSKVYKR